MKGNTLSFVWFAVFGLVLLNIVYQVIKNRGLKGAMFGAPVARTVGELDLGGKWGVRTTVRVHVLEPREAALPQVGLELVTKSIASVSMRGIPLTPEQARSLSVYLSQAASLEGGAR